MRKFNEEDIEKMLTKIEKTDASFEKKVIFPSNAGIQTRRRFPALLVAACVIILAVTSSVLVVLNIGDTVPDASNVLSNPAVSDSEYPQQNNSDSLGLNNSSIISDPNISLDQNISGEENESRNPYGDTDASGDESYNVSDPENKLSLVSFPTDIGFFSGKGLGKLTPKEYFESNHHKYLEGKYNLPVYTRTSLSVDERAAIMFSVGNSLGIDLKFDEKLFGVTGDCRGLNEDNTVSLNVGEYGDWYLYVSLDLMLKTDVSNANVSEKMFALVGGFVMENPNIFGSDKYEYSISQNTNKLSVFLFSHNSDGVLSDTPVFEFTFKNLYNEVYALSSIARNINNMQLLAEYPARSYKAAVESLFTDAIGDDIELDASKDGMLEFVIVGHDVRYLYSSGSDGMYPYYAFVLKFNPYGAEPTLKTVFVPAIDEKYLLKDE